MKPKVLVAHNRYIHRGGEDESREAECAMLRARGHEVVEYVRDNSEIDPAKKAKLALRSIWSRRDYREIRELIRREKIDVVHLHNYLPLISPSIFHAAHDEGVPIVHTLHNYRLACPSAQFVRDGKICEDCLGKTVAWPGVLHGCYRNSRTATAGVAAIVGTHRLLGTWVNKVDAYVVVSRFMRNKLVAAGLPSEKIYLKPNFAPDRGAGRGQGGFALFVGRLSEEKGIGTLLAAWEQVGRKLPLKIVGGGPLESLVRLKSVHLQGVEFLGMLPFQQVFDLMADAAALVVPSEWYEGAPRVIVEALSRGTPVIASNLGGMAELIEHGRSGLLFKAGDANALADAMEQLSSDFELASHLRDGARERFLKNFTEEENYEILHSIYAEVMRSKQAPISA